MIQVECPRCGAQNSADMEKCTRCGEPLPRVTANPQNEPQQAPYLPSTPPTTYLWQSILVTIFCCLPFGIVGIVYASRVESLWYSGRIQESLEASRKARNWAIAGAISVVVAIALYIAIIVMVVSLTQHF